MELSNHKISALVVGFDQPFLEETDRGTCSLHPKNSETVRYVPEMRSFNYHQVETIILKVTDDEGEKPL